MGVSVCVCVCVSVSTHATLQPRLLRQGLYTSIRDCRGVIYTRVKQLLGLSCLYILGLFCLYTRSLLPRDCVGIQIWIRNQGECENKQDLAVQIVSVPVVSADSAFFQLFAVDEHSGARHSQKSMFSLV
jgi:hypothetical protein